MASPLDLYAASKWGVMQKAAFNGSAGAAIRYKITPPDGQDKALFVIKSAEAFRLLQSGDSTVTVDANNGQLGDASTPYPLVIERNKDQFISILGGTTDASDLEIKLDSSVGSWTLEVA